MRAAMESGSFLFWYFLISLILIPTFTIAVDTITPTQPLAQNQTLVSAGGVFQLGFFSPGGNSGGLYIGIWYKEIQDRTIVWVANRDKPITNSTGFLKIGEDGNINLVDGTGNSIWSSSNQSVRGNTIAQLLDSGNLVLRRENDENPENYLWESFDYPTDTLLPGMKLGWDSKTGRNRYISSWKTPTDPSEGDITFKLDINGLPEAFLRKRDNIIYRSGGWNGVAFSGVPEMEPKEVIIFSFLRTKDEVYYSFEIHNKSLFSRLIVNYTEFLERYTWIPETRIWNKFWNAPKDQCDNYRECGPFGICDTDTSPVCNCPVGFKPRNQQAWSLRDGSGGCFRYDELDCRTDGFLTMNSTKLPESSAAFVDATMSLDECKKMCLRNCSCTAYSDYNISNGGSGCVIWKAELLDIRRYTAEGGQLLYVRVAASNAETHPEFDDQVMRSIHVGLLCVQEKAEDRPYMTDVMLMLISEGALLPQPKQPGFCLGNNAAITSSSSSNHNHQSLSLNQLTTLKDGDVIISSGNTFSLGFFTPGNSRRRYVGIWYNAVSEQTAVWVANRNNPMNGTSGVLFLDDTGNLVLRDQRSNVSVWTTNVSFPAKKHSAQLLDTGNLVLLLQDDKGNRVIAWQSFHHPTNTILPYMKFGIDKKAGLDWALRSWKAPDDPGDGQYLYRLETKGIPQEFMYRGSERIWRAGPWNGFGWSGVPEMKAQFFFNLTYVENNKVSQMYAIDGPSVFSRIVLNESGKMEGLTWDMGESKWEGFWFAPKDQCDDYEHCGAFSKCNPYEAAEDFECTCLPGFKPREERDWDSRDGLRGCGRKNGENDACRNGEGFAKLTRMKIPDTEMAVVNMSMELKECEEVCLRNCSCTGFATANVSAGGIGCITWYDDLIDMKEFTDGGGQDMYIRISASELAKLSNKSEENSRERRLVAIAVVSLIAVVLALYLAYYLVMKKKGDKKGLQRNSMLSLNSSLASYQDSSMAEEMNESGPTDVLIFDLNTIISATANFSLENKLGEGGFGRVFKIITGRKNSQYHESSMNLVGYVWDFWREEKALEVVDPVVGNSYEAGEVLRCIHIGLLCVQAHQNDRPAMSDVVFMLCNETTLSSPNPPGFIGRQSGNYAAHSSTAANTSTAADIISCMSVNDMSITIVEVTLSFLVSSLYGLTDTIAFNQTLKDGDLLISGAESFVLGFFTPENSSGRRYVGIWYQKIPERTVVWVANRDSPINGTSGILFIDGTGNLVIQDKKTNVFVWNTSLSSPATGIKAYSVQLQDTGNLVLYHDPDKRVINWQSFDYPTNTLLPFMKFGVDKRTGLNRHLTSWKSPDDPGTGEYEFKIELNGTPQVFLNRGPVRVWRTGPWSGVGWSGVPEMSRNYIFNLDYTENEDEVAMSYWIRDPSVHSIFVLNESGTVNRLTWQGDDVNKWVGFWSAPKDQCDAYAHCGAFSKCNTFNPGAFECTCLPGFRPNSSREWYLRDGVHGCRRNNTDVCLNGEGFLLLSHMKVPDTKMARVNRTIGLKQCEELCLKNCSCTGYASANISAGGMGCITWYDDLIDIKEFTNGGQDIYIRVSASDLVKKSKGFRGKRLIVTMVVPIAALVLMFCCCLVMKIRKGKRLQSKTSLQSEWSEMGKDMDETAPADVLMYDLNTIRAATDNFSAANKLGEGGFGSVYKLSNETSLPHPNPPGFIFKHGNTAQCSSSMSAGNQSVNDVTITNIEGR
nr:G-type lectin S-receptor-like serine/threonine-protein kinase RKS1 [Ipomoea batatas]